MSWAVPPADTFRVPPLLSASKDSVPKTLSVPPLDILVPLATPPASTSRAPPPDTTVAMAVPPPKTSRVFPAPDSTTPLLVTPAVTNWVAIAFCLKMMGREAR